MKKLLFICSRNRLRSPTAQDVFSDYPGIETDSAGLSPDADCVLSEEQVEWADLILLMEPIHKKRLNAKFAHLLKDKKIVVLGIPDNYQYMEESLITLLKGKCSSYLP